MMRLEDWAMVTKSRGTFVTPEMVKNPNLYIRNVVFIGKMVESDILEERKRFKSDIVKSFEEQERERKKLHRSREWSR